MRCGAQACAEEPKHAFRTSRRTVTSPAPPVTCAPAPQLEVARHCALRLTEHQHTSEGAQTRTPEDVRGMARG